MHPPFGFSLFYLRSVAARNPYVDRVTGKTVAPITTGQIYWGAVPFVLIQVLMIALTITFPGMVTRYKSGDVHVDSSKIEIQAPNYDNGAPAGPDFGTTNGNTSPAPQATPPAAPNFGTSPPAPAQ
jgi:hypothetical protein